VVADVGQEVDLTQLMTELPAVEDLLETQDDAPIIRMINALLTQAVRQSASDIHIEPYERNSVVRFRRDGVLAMWPSPTALHAAMASRIKIMASLDIAEKRLPQDGRIALRLAGRQVDVRVSTLPTTHGERIVLRLLDKGSGQRSLDSLGMAPTPSRVCQAARPAPRHPPGHRPHRLRQEHHALRRAAGMDARAATSSPSKTRSNTTCPASARSRSTARSTSPSPEPCARSSGKTRTSS
jgi:general secretion pathway protein E